MMSKEECTWLDNQLRLKGVDAEKIQVEQDLLMEMFDINEEIEDCTDLNQLNKLQNKIKALILSIKENAEILYEKQDYLEMAKEIQKMKYYVKALENVDGAIEQIKQKNKGKN